MIKRKVQSIGLTYRLIRIVVSCALISSTAVLGACSNSSKSKIDPKYGVAASPRVAKGGPIPRGGGRYQVGKPYKIAGMWFHPKEDPDYEGVGIASWYGDAFHGRLTANGEIYDMNTLSAAHPTMPLPSYAKVTNLENRRSVIVRVNDRGPFAKGREIDLSRRAADVLDMRRQGLAKVHVAYVGKARLDGDDVEWLEASAHVPGQTPVTPGYPDGVMLASNQSTQPLAYQQNESVSTFGQLQTSSVKAPPSRPLQQVGFTPQPQRATQGLPAPATSPPITLLPPAPVGYPSSSQNMWRSYAPAARVHEAFEAIDTLVADDASQALKAKATIRAGVFADARNVKKAKMLLSSQGELKISSFERDGHTLQIVDVVTHKIKVKETLAQLVVAGYQDAMVVSN
jgi:rare lipoprotein A (peptidoglycan hydrolase)